MEEMTEEEAVMAAWEEKAQVDDERGRPRNLKELDRKRERLKWKSWQGTGRHLSETRELWNLVPTPEELQSSLPAKRNTPETTQGLNAVEQQGLHYMLWTQAL